MNHIVKKPPIMIEKGVPVPSKHPGGRPKKFPFDEMEVGDSCFVPGMKISGLSANFQKYHRNTTKRFTARSVEGGARFWRIA